MATKLAPTDENKDKLSYTKLQKIVDGCAPPQFVYYELNNHQYIIVSIDIDDSIQSGIYFYDITMDKFDFIASYPKDFSPQSHGMSIDQENHELYIFCGISPIFGVYNIQNNKWRIKNNSNNSIPIVEYPLSLFVSSPYNELYLSSSGVGPFHISKYCKQTDSFVDLVNFDDIPDKKSVSDITFDRCHFCSFQERIYAVDVNRNIWYLNVCINEEQCQKWKLYPYKMQKREWMINTAIVFDTIFIVVYHSGEIHCLDLLSNKWFILEKKFPIFHDKMDQQLVDFVQTSDHYIHCFGFTYEDCDGFHLRISLYDIVPLELMGFYGLLMKGYVRIEIENKYSLMIPNDVVTLIEKYCCIP
eukprot:59835_1